jgi:hypothetical protein
VVARLTYTGTHRGALFGIQPTSKKVIYAGVAIFRISGCCVSEGWVLGDQRPPRRVLRDPQTRPSQVIPTRRRTGFDMLIETLATLMRSD